MFKIVGIMLSRFRKSKAIISEWFWEVATFLILCLILLDEQLTVFKYGI